MRPLHFSLLFRPDPAIRRDRFDLAPTTPTTRLVAAFSFLVDVLRPPTVPPVTEPPPLRITSTKLLDWAGRCPALASLFVSKKVVLRPGPTNRRPSHGMKDAALCAYLLAGYVPPSRIRNLFTLLRTGVLTPAPSDASILICDTDLYLAEVLLQAGFLPEKDHVIALLRKIALSDVHHSILAGWFDIVWQFPAARAPLELAVAEAELRKRHEGVTARAVRKMIRARAAEH